MASVVCHSPQSRHQANTGPCDLAPCLAFPALCPITLSPFRAHYNPMPSLPKRLSLQALREQVALWNGPTAKRWVDQQQMLDRMYAPLEAEALARAGVRPAERAIDVGCGCGASSLELARRVGPFGRVLGLDVSHPMLLRAQRRCRRTPWVSLVQADAATFPLRPVWDLIYSRFGVPFFVSPEQGFANLHRALRPGGRICFITWRRRAENPWYAVPFEAGAKVLGRSPVVPSGGPGAFALASRQTIRSVLSGVGFCNVETKPVDLPLVLPGLTAATEFAWTAVVKNMFADAERRTRGLAVAAMRTALRPYAAGAKVALPAGVWIVSANVPTIRSPHERTRARR
jgi:SAM-dependent methyltransferase